MNSPWHPEGLLPRRVVKPNRELLRTRIMEVFRFQEKLTGVDAADALVQSLLFGIGLVGTRLTWKLREPKSPPQVGKCSAVISLPDDDCPWWLRLNLHQVVSTQERAIELSRLHFLQQPTPVQLRQARDRVKMLRNWMAPISVQMLSAPLRRQQQNVEFLQMVPERGWFKRDNSVFGIDRLLLVRGQKDYRRLLTHREVPPFLLEMESGGNTWPRVTFHGWMRDLALVRTLRELDTETAARLGWIVPAGTGRQQPEGGVDQQHTIDNLFRALVDLRIGRKSYCFVPPPEIAAKLEKATSDLKGLLATQPRHLHAMGFHDDQLVWQLAAVLSLLVQGSGDEPSHPELEEIAVIAGTIAGRIMAGHLNVLRLAVPTSDRGDKLATAIVDRLEKGMATARELVRKFHKVRTEEVEVRLHRLEQDGIVARIGRARWSFVRIPVPDLSAFLSETVANQG